MFSSNASQVSTAANYIEDVFSTYLYTGNGSTQTITNGIDLSGKGGLVWIKNRTAAFGNRIYSDGLTANGYFLYTNSTNGQSNSGNPLTYASNGWSIVSAANDSNDSAYNYVSWTFRKQAKFFDIVTYTGDGTTPRNISHNLGSVPGCIIIKNLTTAQTWPVYHRSLNIAGGFALRLNTTDASVNTGVLPQFFASTVATSTQFTVGNAGATNESGSTFVAYLFAHNAGGFGAAGTDNVISCGSFTGTSKVTLGYEPQFVLMKQSNAASSWYLYDTMRGIFADASNNNDPYLTANNAFAEATGQNYIGIDATGFTSSSAAVGPSDTWIYIAIRRGPMKTPTSGTSVFAPVNYTGTASSQTITTGITSDWVLSKSKNNIEQSIGTTRLSGFSRVLSTTNTNAEVYIDPTYFVTAMNNTAYNLGPGDGNNNTYTYTSWNFRRAPGFFDVVCYTGTGASATLNHNLGVAPNMVIIKGRSVISNWETYLSSLGGTGGNGLAINDSGAKSGTPPVSSATATTFTLNNGVSTSSGQTYVAYLFATLAGVSKVGSYTGTGTTLQIDCGFTGGARFVLIKRTDSTGDWYVWDSARGISSGNDPYLLLNSTAAEVTGTNYVDTDTTGFKVTAAAPAALNASGGTYIFLAIA